ncbi:MAG: 2-amino-4-hydroxy-6-hydroxymethyldihydropteridine diphosphokinase [Pseudomonadota bacterium]
MILIAAGSNLPFCDIDSQELVTRSLFSIRRFLSVVSVSSQYFSPAWPNEADPPFVNAAALVETSLTPPKLLAALHAVEAAFGRVRSVKNAPRTLDLDLIAYHDLVTDGAVGEPILPHPGHASRDFVLAPIAEIAPFWRSPTTGRSAIEMLEALPARSAVKIG